MIIDNFKMALESIKANKMRSFLTMLGIIIGISSVIIIVSAGDGAKNYMMSQFEQAGTTTIMINVDSEDGEESDSITIGDINALRERIPNLKAVTPLGQTYGTANFKSKKQDLMLAYAMPDVQTISALEMLSGRFFNEDDYNSAEKVIVIDDMTAKKFFGSIDVVGMPLDISTYNGRFKMKIIGVFKTEFGDFYMDGMPGTGYMPLSTYLASSNTGNTFTQLMMMSTSKEHTQTVGNAAVSLLEARHGNRGRDVYSAQNMLQQVDMINGVITLIQTFIAAVAAISLLVGGIGVMNIMLVAVTERTREIGIRKSLGAKTRSILVQFLTESAILTLIGGVIGLVLGYLGSVLFCSLANITPVFSTTTIAFTIFFSGSVGIFFGIYPAKKAAKLNPIDALRHE